MAYPVVAARFLKPGIPRLVTRRASRTRPYVGATSGSQTSGGGCATIPTVARVRNRAGGPHSRVRLRLQLLSQKLRIKSHPEGTRSKFEMPQVRQQEC